MTPEQAHQNDVQAIARWALEDMRQWMEVTLREGPAYAQRYATWWMNGQPNSTTPRAPLGMPRPVAEAIRESVREHALMLGKGAA